jgi:hypothetical protein
MEEEEVSYGVSVSIYITAVVVPKSGMLSSWACILVICRFEYSLRPDEFLEKDDN